MSIIEFFQTSSNNLDQIDLELILALVLRKDRVFILTNPNFKLNDLQTKKAKDLIKRRIDGEPLAYLIGHKEFYGLDFVVNKNVLVPRPETEMIVEEALEILDKETDSLLIDVGTGTGCIPIAIISNFKFQISNQKNNARIFGVDISAEALKVARKNTKIHDVDKQIKFLKGDLLTPILNLSKSTIDNRKSKIIITANLPYLTPRQIKDSPSIRREPILALEAGHDGLRCYRRMFSQLKKLDRISKPQMITVLCEIDPGQTTPMSDLINKLLPGSEFEIKKDLAGLDRLAIIKFTT